jgi:hypothetical protein
LEHTTTTICQEKNKKETSKKLRFKLLIFLEELMDVDFCLPGM